MKSSRMSDEDRKDRRNKILQKRQETVNSLRYVPSGFRAKTGKTYPRQSLRQAGRYGASL